MGCEPDPRLSLAACMELHPTAAVDQCKDLSRAHGHSSTIEWWILDMADVNSVEAFCQRWLECDRALDILCNNAGIPSTAKTHMTKIDPSWFIRSAFLFPLLLAKNCNAEETTCLPIPGQPLITCPTDAPTPTITSSERRASDNLHNFLLSPPRSLRS